MLVLTRKKGESIMIGDQIELMVLGTDGDTVKLGIIAPKQVHVFRKEIYESIQNANKEALENNLNAADLSNIFRKKE